jgi:hypothetical protein
MANIAGIELRSKTVASLLARLARTRPVTSYQGLVLIEKGVFMKGIIATLAMLTIVPCLAAVDEWPAAKVQHVISGNGLHFVRILPGEGYGDTVGFKGSKLGAYARGEFYEKQPDRSYKLTADVALQNPVAPVDVLLSNRGYVVTFDNWHNAGYGKVVAMPAFRLCRPRRADEGLCL